MELFIVWSKNASNLNKQQKTCYISELRIDSDDSASILQKDDTFCRQKVTSIVFETFQKWKYCVLRKVIPLRVTPMNSPTVMGYKWYLSRGVLS